MDGIVIVNKPVGITSYDVIRKLKRVFNTKKIGHGGTLDPFATGVLIIAVNQGTKITRFFLNDDKAYIAKLKLGEMTDSFDLTGQIINQNSDKNVEKNELEGVVHGFLGKQEQIPPMHSAKKVGGVKLYKMARAGIEIERKPATVNITDIRLTEFSYPFAVVSVECSKGTYIRALANDIGLKLGSYAHLVELTRTKSGYFTLDKACTIEELEEAKESGNLADMMLSLNDALDFMPAVTVRENAVMKVRNGVKLSEDDIASSDPAAWEGSRAVKIISEDSILLAIAESGANKTLKYLRGFN